MNNFFEVGKHVGLKTYRLCNVVFRTILRLAFICCLRLRSKILSGTVHGLGMSRQMGTVVSKCRDNNHLEADNKLLMQQLQEALKENGRLQQELDELKEIRKDQDEMIGKQFAKNVERTAQGRCNIAGDMNQPMALSTKFKKIFNSEWLEVMRRLFRKENELKGIRYLSDILQACQSFCQKKAKEQVMQFVYPYTHVEGRSIEEVISSDEEQHDFYKLRRKIGLYADNKEALIKLFTTECKESEGYRSLTQSDGEAMDCLDDYIRSCCEFCWQFAISIPPVYLEFDVLGRHKTEIEDWYQVYPYENQIDGEDQTEGVSNTVRAVVWPAVVRKKGDIIDELLDKGSVIVFSSSSV